VVSLNRQVFDFIHNYVINGPLGIERAVVFGAIYIPFVAALICLVAVFMEHNRHRWHWFVIEIGVSVFVAVTVLADNLQLFFGHLRPYAALNFIPAISPVHAFAFPSAHASALFALALTVRFHHKKAGDVLIFLALVNGLARVAVGVHWPVDILGGIVVGAVAALTAHAFTRFAEETFRHRTP